MIGILLIVILAIRGFKKGFVNMLGEIAASVLSIVFVIILNQWALDALLMTLWADYMIVIVRVVLCIALYAAAFFVLRAVIMSLRLVTKLPIIRSVNKFLGLLAGTIYGLLLVGIIFAFFV